MDLGTFWDCHRRAFAHFGGVPGSVVYDRTKTVISRITSIYERDEITASVPVRPSTSNRPHSPPSAPPTRSGDDKPEAVARHYQAERAWLDDTTATVADTP